MTGTSNVLVVFGKNWADMWPNFTVLLSFRSVKLSFKTSISSTTCLIMNIYVYSDTQHTLLR